MRDFQQVISTPRSTYAEALRFFEGTGMLNDALGRLVSDLERKEIEYAIVGAVALNQHGFPRLTVDIDILLTADGLERFRNELVGLGYRPAFEGARKQFRTSDNVPIDVIVSGEYPGDGLPKAVVFPNPSEFSVEIDGVQTISLEKLIELKLASGISAPHRLKDLADVQELIKIKHFDVSFAEKLDETVRAKFLELLDAVTSAGEELNLP